MSLSKLRMVLESYFVLERTFDTLHIHYSFVFMKYGLEFSSFKLLMTDMMGMQCGEIECSVFGIRMMHIHQNLPLGRKHKIYILNSDSLVFRSLATSVFLFFFSCPWATLWTLISHVQHSSASPKYPLRVANKYFNLFFMGCLKHNRVCNTRKCVYVKLALEHRVSGIGKPHKGIVDRCWRQFSITLITVCHFSTNGFMGLVLLNECWGSLLWRCRWQVC